MSLAATNFARGFGDRLKGPSLTIWLCGATLLVFLAWASIAALDEIVRADGEVIAASRPQIIQNLEGGILAEMAVAEGDVVEKGAVLARLHGTGFRSSVDDLNEQIAALDIRRLRLEAELAGQYDFDVPVTLTEQAPGMAASERALLRARQQDYVSRTDGAKRVLDEAARERDLMEDLLKKNVVALIEVTRARKAHADALTRYEEIVTTSELERAQLYSDVLKELATLRQNLKASSDQLNRTVLVAPLRGVVNNLKVTTIGGVVRPGEEIMQITPLGEALFVEARVLPENIAGIREGQAATVKLSAYDYTIWGALKAEVAVVSADTHEDRQARGPDAEPHYKVMLRVMTPDADSRQAGMEIRPGMQAQVELHTGEKTVLHYLMKPLWKSREALREP